MTFPQIGTEVGYSINPAQPDPQHTQMGQGLGSANPDQDNASKGNRQGVYERNGAKYAPQVTYVYPNEQVSAQTERNVRILPPAMGNKPFWQARGEQGNTQGV